MEGAAAAAAAVVRAAKTQMTSKIQKVAVGGGKFEMRRVLVPAKVGSTEAASSQIVATSSAGILAAESRLAAKAASSSAVSITTVKTTLKRSLSSALENRIG